MRIHAQSVPPGMKTHPVECFEGCIAIDLSIYSCQHAFSGRIYVNALIQHAHLIKIVFCGLHTIRNYFFFKKNYFQRIFTIYQRYYCVIVFILVLSIVIFTPCIIYNPCWQRNYLFIPLSSPRAPLGIINSFYFKTTR